MMKRLISIIIACALTASAVLMSSCGGAKTEETAAATDAATTAAATEAEKTSSGSPAFDDLKKMGINTSKLGISPVVTYAEDEDWDFQLDKPEKGEQIAVIHTTEGDISLKLFPKYAPKTVENFIALAKAGKYDGVIFHRVINDFMIQGGDYENQNGTGGTSSFGEEFEDEFCDKLVNIRGSIAMANSGADTNGSQFFINQNSTNTVEDSEATWSQIKSQLEQYKSKPSTLKQMLEYYSQSYYNGLLDTDSVPDGIRKLYKDNGGNPSLDGAYNIGDRGHTVFGQVIDGMDVVDKIAAVKTDDNNKPKKDVKIKTVEITEYK